MNFNGKLFAQKIKKIDKKNLKNLIAAFIKLLLTLSKYKLVDHLLQTIESLTQASIFSPPQVASSLLDSVAEAQRVQVSTRRTAVNSTQPKHS